MISKGLKEKMRGNGWLTITEAAHLFSISHSTLYRLISLQAIPAKRIGGTRTSQEGGRGAGTLFVEKKALEVLQGGIHG